MTDRSTFDQLAIGVGLYAPPAPPEICALYFLLAESNDPPATVALADMWSNSGSPACPGALVFADAPAPPEHVSAFAAKLYELLHPTGAPLSGYSQIGWIHVDPDTGMPELLATLSAKHGPSGAPILGRDFQAPLPAGMVRLGIGAGAPLTMTAGMDAIVIGCAPDAGPVDPADEVLRIPLFGALGATFTFVALAQFYAGSPYALASNVVDFALPDGGRSGQVLLGPEYVVTKVGETLWLEPS